MLHSIFEFPKQLFFVSVVQVQVMVSMTVMMMMMMMMTVTVMMVIQLRKGLPLKASV